MKVLVTGGSGYTVKVLDKRLFAERYEPCLSGCRTHLLDKVERVVGIKLGVGGCSDVTCDTKQGAESIEWASGHNLAW